MTDFDRQLIKYCKKLIGQKAVDKLSKDIYVIYDVTDSGTVSLCRTDNKTKLITAHLLYKDYMIVVSLKKGK